MTQAPDIRFIGMEPSGALATMARERAHQLDRVHAGIMSCQIAIEQARKRAHSPLSYHVRVGLLTSQRELTITCRGDDVYATLRDAFDGSGVQLAGGPGAV